MVFIPQKYNNFNLRIRMLFLWLSQCQNFCLKVKLFLETQHTEQEGGGGYYVTDLVTYTLAQIFI